MKTIRIIFVLFYCLLFANVEVFPQLLKRENQWNELTENYTLPPEYRYRKTYITKIGNDTLINGVNYYELLTTNDELSSIWLENGYIREDVENRKVYYKPDDGQEALLYDFNAQVGDEIQSYDFRYERNVVITVEAINLVWINGIARKQMNVRSKPLNNDYEYEDHVWIEGIGNMDGFLRSTMARPCPGSDWLSLLCFFQNEELVYKPGDTNVSDCFVWETPEQNSIQSIKDNSVIIYPNPADDLLTVSALNGTVSRIEIFDSSGRKLYTQTHEKAINVSSFSKGLYLLKVYNTTGQIFVFKIIKK